MHEQSAVHLADGYYRATGQPMLAFTSIGPGATNTVVGMATAYVDSTAVALMTGSPHTYMRGHGLLQELERRHVADNPRIFEPVVKEWWQPSRVDELPFVLHRAWNQMVSGRPGPVLLDLPMDVQADSAEVTCRTRTTRGARPGPPGGRRRRARGHAAARGAKRPVIVAGGGAITRRGIRRGARHSPSGSARRSSRPGTARARSTRPTTSPRTRSATRPPRRGNALAAVGRRPPVGRLPVHGLVGRLVSAGRDVRDPADPLIQIDIDPREIGKNYPVEVALVGDARAGLADLLEALGPAAVRAAYRDDAYFEEIQRAQGGLGEQVEVKSGSTRAPMTMARAVREVQAATRDGRDRRDRRRPAPGHGQAALGHPASRGPT